MKTRFNRSTMPVILAAGLALACSWSAAAEDVKIFSDADSLASSRTNGVYVSGDAGLSIMQNMTAVGNVIQYHVGPRIDVGTGYNFTQNIAAELQAGFAFNSWSAVNGVSTPRGDSAKVWTVPVMASGIYKYSLNDHWQAYGGLGAGVLISTLNINNPVESSSSTDCTFGYQAMVGIKWTFDTHFEWGLGYNFLGSLDHHWNDLGRDFTFSPTYMHSVLVSLTYRF